VKVKRPLCGLFIDAGFANCGAVVIDIRTWKIRAYRVLRTEVRDKESQALGFFRRAREQAFQLQRLCSDHNVQFLCGELPTGGSKSARALAFMSMANVILSVFCALQNKDFLPVTPTEIKRLVRPKGAVDKKEVEPLVEEAFGKFLPKKKETREHLSDAAASALVAQRKYSDYFSTKISEL
jgi:Holliday junction resolvasome RuvABC endonuclease subunit